MYRTARTAVFAAMVVAGAMASAPVAASASSQAVARPAAVVLQFCTAVEDVPHDCINDWGNGGAGTTIRMDDQGDSNQNFIKESIPGRCGGTVTSNCPFNGPEGAYFDSQYHGFPIVELLYGGITGNHCLATGGPGNSNAVLGSCINTTTGVGGSNGAAFVDHNGFMINVYWTNIDNFGNNASCMEQTNGTGIGSTVNLNYPTGFGCQVWAQF